MLSFVSLCEIDIQITQLTLPNDYRNYEYETKFNFPGCSGKNANDSLKHLNLNWTYLSLYSLDYFK